MSAARRLGILGGTFDPIHVGHLDAAEAARTSLHLDEVLLIPSHDPPHRNSPPRASAFQRFALVALAIEDRPAYRVSDMELERGRPSLTAPTLRALHDEGWRPSQLFFILGTDAFAEIATWSEFPGVLDGAHFVVIARPGTTLEAVSARTPSLAARMHGVQAGVPEDGNTRVFLLEARTRDVSSTTIRARIAAQQPIDDLVPAGVARHITTHHLYEAVGGLHGEH
jgi:nicotinate-nucleotide adenylyltransferase